MSNKPLTATYFSKPIGPSVSNGSNARREKRFHKISYESTPIRHMSHGPHPAPASASANSQAAASQSTKQVFMHDRRVLIVAVFAISLVILIALFYVLGLLINYSVGY